MANRTKFWLLVLSLWPWACAHGGAEFYPGTLFARTNIFKSTSAADARARIGVSATPVTVIEDNLVVDLAGNIGIPAGALATNLNAYGWILGESNSTVLYVRPDGAAAGVRGNPRWPYNTLSNALNAVQNGDTVVVMPGQHQIGGNVKRWRSYYTAEGCNALLSTRSNVTIAGYPGLSILTNGGGAASGLVISNCSGITIKGLTFKGYHPMTNELTGFAPFGHMEWCDSEKIVVENCEFEEGMDFAIAGDSGYSRQTTNCIIRNCNFRKFPGMWVTTDNRWDGGAITCGSDTLVAGCYFYDCNQIVEPYDAGAAPRIVDGVTIVNNRALGSFNGVATSFAVTNVFIGGNDFMSPTNWANFMGSNAVEGWASGAYSLISFPKAANVQIIGNQLKGGGDAGSVYLAGTNLTVINNTISDCLNSGIYIAVALSSNWVVQGNIIRNARGSAAIGVSGTAGICRGNTIYDVDPGGGAVPGIQLFRGTNCVIEQNTVFGSGTAVGVWVNDAGGAVALRGNRLFGGGTKYWQTNLVTLLDGDD